MSWSAIPVSLIISVLLVHYKIYHNETSPADLPFDLFCASVAGFLNLLAQVSLVKAFRYENPTKIAITKTTDVVFACLLQYLLLGMGTDALTLVGCLSILLATLIILVFELIDKKYSENWRRKNGPDNNVAKNFNELMTLNIHNENVDSFSEKSLLFRCVFHKL